MVFSGTRINLKWDGNCSPRRKMKNFFDFPIYPFILRSSALHTKRPSGVFGIMAKRASFFVKVLGAGGNRKINSAQITQRKNPDIAKKMVAFVRSLPRRIPQYESVKKSGPQNMALSKR